MSDSMPMALSRQLFVSAVVGGAMAILLPLHGARAGDLFSYWGGGDCSGGYGHSVSPWRHHGFPWGHHHKVEFPVIHPPVPWWPVVVGNHRGQGDQASGSGHGYSGHEQWNSIGLSHRFGFM